jgi:5'-methylthioadenosine phosphorylase
MRKAQAVRLAVIGGSGLYDLPGIKVLRELRIKTPFGAPSDAVVVGELSGVRCAFLPRHGRGHRLLPTEVNGRANIWALKSLGVERILAFGAVGSLREDLAPRHFVFPDQLVDETKHRDSTFFGDGVVAHVAFAHPFCGPASELLHRTAREIGLTAHRGGVYCCMEGPAFSTKAESETHRRLGYSIIGMTSIAEAKLAREAEICYAPAAMITDYDCWKEDDEVSTSKVVEHLMANVANARRLLAAALPELAVLPRTCPCASAMKDAIFTQEKARNRNTLRKLRPIVGRYVGAHP